MTTTTTRRGDWLMTYSGVQFWPLDPRPEEIRLEDIAHALSLLCRFGGHIRTLYSVAQHSVLVARHCPHELRAAGLFHDAPEAYCIDVPSPIKRHLVGYDAIEHGLAQAISIACDVDLVPLDARVKEQDLRALWTEKRDLRAHPGKRELDVDIPAMPWPEAIVPWSPEVAEATFLEEARWLAHAGLLKLPARGR